MPIIRAMWLHFSNDPLAVARGDQYMWGRDMLVAPVVEKGATSRKVYLPKGKWVDFWTEEIVEGGREITRAVDLATTPLYVRAGAVIPMGPVKQYTGEKSIEPLALVAYAGADGRGALYEDDGSSMAYKNAASQKRWTFTFNNSTKRVTISGPANNFKTRVVGK
jgi:alpha-glucosidase/alpha-D-xyloside xylohydrolase